jgi:hypothetical protein
LLRQPVDQRAWTPGVLVESEAVERSPRRPRDRSVVGLRTRFVRTLDVLVDLWHPRATGSLKPSKAELNEARPFGFRVARNVPRSRAPVRRPAFIASRAGPASSFRRPVSR